ncbi:MAG: hypothetical protein P4L92_01165 [Rudaea sp.]|nr:hypothetical protein [Rudaea sp.]
MIGDNLIVAVDNDGHIETELPGASSNLTQLLGCMDTGVARIEFQISDQALNDAQGLCDWQLDVKANDR